MNTLLQQMSRGKLAVSAPRQRGVTLVIALIFLVVLTLLGVGMVRSTTSEERMSSNARDYDLAFAAAEAALRDAEIRIKGSSPSDLTPLAQTSFPQAPNTCFDGLCYFDPTVTTTPPIWLNTTYTFESTYASTLGRLTNSPLITMQNVTTVTQPKYFIEMVQRPNYGSTNPNDKWFYRITAKGYGARGNTQVLLQEGVRLP